MGKKKHIGLRVKKSKLFSGDFVSFGKQDKYRRKRDLLAEFILETNYPSGTNYPLIRNGNRIEWSPIRSVIIREINKIGRPRSGSPVCLITRPHEVLLPDNHNHYNFLDESLSRVANSSILENPQFGKVSGCRHGYCDKLWDWWIKLGDWLMQLSDFRCPITANCPISLSGFSPTQ